MKKQNQLMAALIAGALILSCGGDDNDVDVGVSIAEITNVTTTSARVTVSYSAGNVSVVEVGIVYGATPGRLNIKTIINSGDPNVDYGVVSTPASVSGKFYADLENLADGTTYFAAPFVKLDKASPEFPDGYFLPSGYKEFKTDIVSGSAPAVSKTAVSEITFTSARFEALIVSAGDPEFRKRGFCYSASPEPMLDDGSSTCVPVSGPDFLFYATVTNLSGNTAYYVRAYASNNRHATQYGQQEAFRTTGGDDNVLIDTRDGRRYRTTVIGQFTWMAENLDYAAADSWCYGGDNANCAKYGRLYTKAAASNACPAGWQLPTQFQWNNLTAAAGGAANAARTLKSTAWDGTDNFGFTALPGGYRDRAHVRIFVDMETAGRWWTAAGYLSMQSGANNATENSGAPAHEYSVRCVQERE
ncbi:MAG: hypothetical protein FWB85_11735 [Chitinispirillia bacterium]|nr:hypothetical protein [Chitinispirillia bacterium]